MDKTSLYKLSGIPDSFGVVLLTFAFILLLAPYFSGADFGLFKIPVFGQPAKKWLKIIGPIAFLACAFPFVPVFVAGHKVDEGATKSLPSPIISPSIERFPTPNQEPSPAPSVSDLASRRQDAEKLGTDWLAALLRNDVDTLVQLSDLPFYFDQEILVREEDLRNRYQQMGAKQKSPSLLKLQSIKVQTIAELKQGGYDTTKDRLLDSLHLDDDDFAITLMVGLEGLSSKAEGIGLFTRKRANKIKLAGWWD